MINDFALDLKVSRKKSGLTQADSAHLVGCSTSRISNLERGKMKPTLDEICALSLIYRRTYESLFGGIVDDVRERLAQNLATLQNPMSEGIETFNRKNSLDALAAELLRDDQNSHGR